MRLVTREYCKVTLKVLIYFRLLPDEGVSTPLREVVIVTNSSLQKVRFVAGFVL